MSWHSRHAFKMPKLLKEVGLILSQRGPPSVSNSAECFWMC